MKLSTVVVTALVLVLETVALSKGENSNEALQDTERNVVLDFVKRELGKIHDLFNQLTDLIGKREVETMNAGQFVTVLNNIDALESSVNALRQRRGLSVSHIKDKIVEKVKDLVQQLTDLFGKRDVVYEEEAASGLRYKRLLGDLATATLEKVKDLLQKLKDTLG